jgi:hypothetical protein
VSPAVGLAGHQPVADAAPDGDVKGTDKENTATREVKKQNAEDKRFQRLFTPWRRWRPPGSSTTAISRRGRAGRRK